MGFVFTRCFLQKKLQPAPGLSLTPLGPSGSQGTIHDAIRALGTARFAFDQQDLAKTVASFQETGYNVLVEFEGREAVSFQDAIDKAEIEAQAAASALAVIAANPAVPLVAFAEGLVDSGVKFFIPADRRIMHGTNIAGFLDAVPALTSRAQSDPKLATLLRLYRASLRDPEIDNQLLFQLILLEEASDSEPESTLAKRLRAYASRHGLADSFAHAAAQAGVTLPQNKDAIDLMVALRNAAAHNGSITESGLRDYGADWAVPLLAGKQQLHHFVNEALRVLFCLLVGQGPGQIMTKVTGSLEIKFD